MIPVLTILGLQFAFLLAGTIIIENVFYLPGLGRLVFQAITQRDLIVVESVVMLLVAAVIAVNILVDISYAIVDPRLRVAPVTAPAAPQPETAASFVAKAFSSRSFLIGFVITAAIAAMAIVSYFWTPYDITRLIVSDKLQPPSAVHWFGTDHFGRDILSMVMIGARNSIAVALVAVGIGMGVGVPLGALAAARGGCSTRR